MFAHHLYILCHFAEPANITTSPNDALVYVSTSITLTCTAFGIPLPNISWTLPNGSREMSPPSEPDGSSLVSGELRITSHIDISSNQLKSELTIQHVKLEDAGRYTCTATNRVTNTTGPNDTASAALTILGND